MTGDGEPIHAGSDRTERRWIRKSRELFDKSPEREQDYTHHLPALFGLAPAPAILTTCRLNSSDSAQQLDPPTAQKHQPGPNPT